MAERVDLNFLVELKDTMDREIITLTNILESKKEHFINLKNIIYKTCDHIWIDDFIDNGRTGISVKISYCKKCGCKCST
jgi:hypothetical protein